MEPMMKIINALAALTAALQEYTAQTTDGYLATFETIYEPTEEELQEIAPKEPPAPKDEPVTFVQLRSRLSVLCRSGHTQEIKALIAKYGAEKLSDIAESDYAAVLAEAEGLV